MKCRKCCNECGQKKGEHHLIGCSKEEGFYCEMPDIKDVKAEFVEVL